MRDARGAARWLVDVAADGLHDALAAGGVGVADVELQRRRGWARC